jgi:heme exporter protein C
MLILLFLYLGHSVILHADRHVDRAAKIAAVYAVLGAVNIPIIKWSVNWWSTLHQPASVIRWGAPTIHISMLLPLLCVALGFLGLFFGMLTMRGCAIVHARKVRPTSNP